ncbi:hypothetical protein T439DRAFT_337746 [Meredithblackwellia eburnea MCA 4105]
MALANDAIPAILFLVLYFIFFAFCTFLFFTKRVSWKSRYTFVYFHCLMRLAGQACGIGFAVLTWDDFQTRLNFLVAYLVLSAEGYFSLVLCSYRFLVVWQSDRLGDSNIEPRIPKGTPFRTKMRILSNTPMAVIHSVLIGANVMIVIGGSYLSRGLTPNNQDSKLISVGKVLRVVGTALFLSLVQLYAFYALQSWQKRNDRTLLAIVCVWPFLTVRGVYGILSIVLDQFSYYNSKAYSHGDNGNGLATPFLVAEYVMGTSMEFISCGLLLATYFGRDQIVEDFQREEMEKENEVRTSGERLTRRSVV